MKVFDLVLIPFWDWKKCEQQGFRVRDAHMLINMMNMPSIGRILVVGRPTTPLEMLATRRWWRPRKGKVVYQRGWTSLMQVAPNVFSLDILIWDFVQVIKLGWGWWTYSLQQEKVINAIQYAQTYLDMIGPVLMISTPMSFGPIGRLGEQLLVSSLDDNWLQHTGVTRDSDLKDIQKGYDILFKQSDLVIVNSDVMKHSFEHYRNDVFVIPNGISVDRFDRFTVPPSDLARIPRPWVGYAGTITSRVDEELVAWLAEQRQNVHFVFLGPLMDPARFRSLFKHPNVHYLGNKHYSDLPDYLLNFDVSIIPHRTGRHENDGDSLKVFEYLASGKPVVSTNTLDIAEAVWPVIKRCSSRESFLSALDEYLALSEAERQALASQLRLAIPPERDWNFLTRKAISVIQGKLREISSQIELNQF